MREVLARLQERLQNLLIAGEDPEELAFHQRDVRVEGVQEGGEIEGRGLRRRGGPGDLIEVADQRIDVDENAVGGRVSKGIALVELVRQRIVRGGEVLEIRDELHAEW